MSAKKKPGNESIYSFEHIKYLIDPVYGWSFFLPRVESFGLWGNGKKLKAISCLCLADFGLSKLFLLLSLFGVAWTVSINGPGAKNPLWDIAKWIWNRPNMCVCVCVDPRSCHQNWNRPVEKVYKLTRFALAWNIVSANRSETNQPNGFLSISYPKTPSWRIFIKVLNFTPDCLCDGVFEYLWIAIFGSLEIFNFFFFAGQSSTDTISKYCGQQL